MSRYDGLIIPRSYNEYINKTDPVAMSQALQLNGVLADIVQDGNLKAVTSNAVFDLSSTNNPTINAQETALDIYTVLDNLPIDRVTNLRFIGQYISHSPNGDVDCDFCYTAYKIYTNDFYTVMAYDVRSKLIYTNSKVNGTWDEWALLSKVNGLIPKNKTLRLIFNKPFVDIDGCIVVQGIGGMAIKAQWHGGNNGIVQLQSKDGNNFMKLVNLSGSIGTLTYTIGNGFIDIFNPNDETEAFEFTSNVKNYLVF